MVPSKPWWLTCLFPLFPVFLSGRFMMMMTTLYTRSTLQPASVECALTIVWKAIAAHLDAAWSLAESTQRIKPIQMAMLRTLEEWQRSPRPNSAMFTTRRATSKLNSQKIPHPSKRDYFWDLSYWSMPSFLRIRNKTKKTGTDKLSCIPRETWTQEPFSSFFCIRKKCISAFFQALCYFTLLIVPTSYIPLNRTEQLVTDRLFSNLDYFSFVMFFVFLFQTEEMFPVKINRGYGVVWVCFPQFPNRIPTDTPCPPGKKAPVSVTKKRFHILGGQSESLHFLG